MEFDINRVIKKGKIDNELDYQRALISNRKLRVQSQDNPDLQVLRDKLLIILKQYQDENWKDYESISDEKVKESDLAEYIAEKEREFTKRRKQIIKKRLKDLNLNQQQLGSILGHRKPYTSELINGVRPFSMKDIVILNRILNIDLNELVPTILSTKVRNEIAYTIKKLNNPHLKKLSKEDLEPA
jgi:predicted XRE-type DNA-binding protein